MFDWTYSSVLHTCMSCSVDAAPPAGSPGSPVDMSITKTSSALTIHWSEGDVGAAPVTGYVIEARPSGTERWWQRAPQSSLMPQR